MKLSLLLRISVASFMVNTLGLFWGILYLDFSILPHLWVMGTLIFVWGASGVIGVALFNLLQYTERLTESAQQLAEQQTKIDVPLRGKQELNNLVQAIFFPFQQLLREKESLLMKVDSLSNQVQTIDSSLKKSEEQYIKFSENSLEGVIFHDQGKIIDANPTFSRMLGYSQQEVIGKNLLDFVVPRYQEIASQHILSEREEPYELEIIERNGGVLLIEVEGRKVFHQDQLLYMITSRDISKQKQARDILQMYEYVLSTTNELISFVNKNYIYKSINQAYLSAYDLPKERILGNSVEDLHGSEVFHEVLKPLLDQCLTGEITTHQGWFEYPILGRRFMEVNHYPFFEESTIPGAVTFFDPDSITGIVVSIKDLTAKKQMEEEIQMKNQFLFHQARYAQMGEMLSMIAHQWRQPLASITSVVGVLIFQTEMGQVDLKALRSYLDQINSYAKFLSGTIQDFQDFFKPNKEKEEAYLPDLLKKTLTIISKKLATDKIQVEQDLNLEKAIQTYPNELMQVFLNIITNAQDVFLERNVENPKINIILYEDNEYQFAEFLDNAGGIDTKIIGKIFDPYFTTKDKTRGTGIGLYMSKLIIENHLHGKLRAKNIDGGANFTIKLPLKIEK